MPIVLGRFDGCAVGTALGDMVLGLEVVGAHVGAVVGIAEGAIDIVTLRTRLFITSAIYTLPINTDKKTEERRK